MGLSGRFDLDDELDWLMDLWGGLRGQFFTAY